MGGTAVGERTLILTVPDWPATALGMAHGAAIDDPVIVLSANRVTSCNAPARAVGVDIGLNKRAARTRCPHAHVWPRDHETEHREFAVGVSALEKLVARFTLLQPGTVSIPIRAVERTYPTEDSAVEALLTALTDTTGWEVFAGLADSPFAALLAARTATRVPPGRTPDYLAALPVSALSEADPSFADFVSLCRRLGLDRLGDVAALPHSEIYARFGEQGARAHRLASGLRDRLPLDHVRARDFRAHTVLDPPSTRSDALSFAARKAAAGLLSDVRAAGLVCPQITISLTAANGERSVRTWRLDAMDESQVADRARWQAEGWLASRSGGTVRAGSRGAGHGGADHSGAADASGQDVYPDDLADDGISMLELLAAELLAPLEAQHNLFDAQTGEVGRTLERLQGLFGADSVVVPSLQGGREPRETNVWTPWKQSTHPQRDPAAPWPGQLPSPRPTIVDSTPVDLLDAHGNTVIARPAGLDSAPALLHVPGVGDQPIVDFSSSWPVEAMWWESQRSQYRVRLQVVTEDGQALLLAKEQGQWTIAGRYA